MTEISSRCTEGCAYGATICAGPGHFCQLRRDELLHDAEKSAPSGANMMNHPAAEAIQRDAREMLHRLTDRELCMTDPLYKAQLHFTEQMVAVLVESLVTSEVRATTAIQVVEKFILGMLPSAAQAQALLDNQRRLTDVLSRTSFGKI